MPPKAAAKAPAAKAAPKADAKPKAESKAKPKKEKVEKDPEDEIEKVLAPDKEAHTEKLNEINQAIEKLQKKAKDISNKIGDRSHGKEDFQKAKAEVRRELDEYTELINSLQEQKDKHKESKQAAIQEGKEKRAELNKMQKNLGFTSDVDIDERIATLEYKLWTESKTLKEEKAILKEISELKKSKPKLANYEKMRAEMTAGSDIKPQLDAFSANIETVNAKLQEYKQAKKDLSAKLAALQEERTKQMGDVPELVTQRETINKQVQEKIKERNEIRDTFRQAERAYNDYLAEIRRKRAAKYQEERDKRQKVYEQERRQKAAEKLEEQPHVRETTLIEQTIAFCKRNMPQESISKEKDEKKATEYDVPDGGMVLLKKEDRDEEFYFAPTKKGKAAKNKPKKEGEGNKAIKHNAETFRLFGELKLDAPITTDQIPAVLEKLEEQMASYQEKIAEWKEKREEMKRKILEDGVMPEDEEKQDEKEEKEEEEKAEVGEEKEEAAEEAADEAPDEEKGED